MNDFTIDEDAASVPPRPATQEAPKGLYKLVISLGLAKDLKGARMVLVIVAVAAIVLAVVYPFLFS